ncbi:MAG: peptidase C11 [Oscillospiraceae bacterium]|nr:peptidase C11 [Oscillospiraceae bacterium]
MDNNRPRGRQTHITGKGKDIYRRGEGLGTGPVGSADGHSGRMDSGSSSGGGKRAGGRSPLMTIIVIAVMLLGGGGAGLSGLLGGGSSGQDVSVEQPESAYVQQQQQPSTSSGMSQTLSSLLGSYGGVSDGWSAGSNTGRLNTAVASGARAKRTTILGGGQDTVTLMVYLCGTDLESKYGMGTADLQEMASATLSDKINLIVYTGGCKQWKNSSVSSSINQIYKIERGGLLPLAQDKSAPAMTEPSTLSGFIQYCAEHYPANRNALILWDHGGGSLSGYGYDEKYARAGSMSLGGIDRALSDAGVSFDFIGFDACLMATLENALMLSKHADYLIASEETEPGVGWYYTNWLSKLSANTSMPTIEIGKNIVDDFVSVCAQKCRGQDTTLSVVDLAELECTVPETFRAFAADTLSLQESDFARVSHARGSAREFAASNKIDQVDMVHLATNLGSDDAQALADALLSAVKYNKTSSSVSNAYGLSVYFPYRRTAKVSTAAATYDDIGLDDEYTRCIRQFASMGAAAQTVSGSAASNAGSPLGSLLGTVVSSGGSALAGSDQMTQALLGILSGSIGGGRAMDTERAAAYLTEHQLDAAQLVWLGDEPELRLSEEQWALVNDLALSVFYDDGNGYIDLGLDNVFSFTDDGALRGAYDGSWLAIDEQPVAYYHLADVYEGDNYVITGYVPCLLNGERAELLLTFDNDRPYGVITGARRVYNEGETETVAKSVTELSEGDTVEFVCDYYSYGGEYRDSFLFGAPWTYHADAQISNVLIPAERTNATYRFTDVYGQHYWTSQIP